MTHMNANDLLLFAELLYNQQGKHVKKALQELERSGKLDKATRKIILDAFNGMRREVLQELGLQPER